MTLPVKLVLPVHENKANDSVDLRLLRQQILAMQKTYDAVVSPATIAKTILGEFKGFNPFNLLKHSFWYCSPVCLFFQLDAIRCEENSLD
jgi:hypothetical protein